MMSGDDLQSVHTYVSDGGPAAAVSLIDCCMTFAILPNPNVVLFVPNVALPTSSSRYALRLTHIPTWSKYSRTATTKVPHRQHNLERPPIRNCLHDPQAGLWPRRQELQPSFTSMKPISSPKTQFNLISVCRTSSWHGVMYDCMRIDMLLARVASGELMFTYSHRKSEETSHSRACECGCDVGLCRFLR